MPLTANEDRLLRSAVRLNTKIAAASAGLVAGLVVWVATAALLLQGGDRVGPHLSLLATFLPGFAISWPGAFIGLFWSFVFGAVGSAVMYSAYAATLRSRIERQLATPDGVSSLRTPTFVISANGLGLGLGAAIALQQFVLTNWLVLRGSADQSTNAALLAHYLPGYTVSLGGSVIAAAQLFAWIYAGAALLAWIYNRLARRRRAIDR